jgi:hypothetical protein
MKTHGTLVSDSTRSCFRRAGFALATVMAALGLAGSAGAQSYTISNIWNLAAGTGANNLAGGADGGNRGLAYSTISNQVFVSYRAGSFSYPIDVYDGLTGNLVSTTNGVNGSKGLNADQIACADDGVLYATPLFTSVTASSFYKIYSWSDWNGPSNLCFTSTATDPVVTTLSGTKRIGDTMAVTGSGTSTIILEGVGTLSAWVILSTTDGINFTSTVLTNSSITGLGNVYGLCFYTNNTFVVHPNASSACYLVQFPPNFASLPSPVATTLLGTATIPSPAFANLAFSPAGQMLLAVTNFSAHTTGLNLYSTTNFPAAPAALANTTFAAPNSYANGTGGAALGGTGKTNYAYAMTSDNGLQGFQIIFTAAASAPTIALAGEPVAVGPGAYPPQTLTVSATGTAPLAYQWSVNSSNSFTGASAISGATSSAYTISTASTNYYFVVVTNSAGSVTSSIALVSLIPATVNSVVTNLFSIASGNLSYPFLLNDDNARGLAYDTNTSRLVVANKSGGAHLYMLDASTGTNIGSMNVTGMYPGGTFPVDQVRIADDGVVYAGNLALTGNGDMFSISSWSSVSAGATVVQAYGPGDPGAGSGERWGDTMAIRGAGINTQILVPSRNGTNVALFTTADGINFTCTLLPITGVSGGFAGLGIAFGAGNTFWAKSSSRDLVEIAYDPVALTNTVPFDYTSGTQTPSSMVGLGVDSVRGILGGVVLNDQNPDLQLFQLTGNSTPPVLFDQAFFPVYNPSANGNGLAVVDMKYPRVYAMDVDIGIIGMTYGVPASTPPSAVSGPSVTIYATSVPYNLSVSVSGTLPLSFQWQKNSVSNLLTATNIPGATSGSLTFNPPTTNNTGWYDLIVTNFGGKATSAPVLLTVLAPLTSTFVTQAWVLPANSRPYLDSSSYNTRGLAYDTNTATVLVADHNATAISVLNAADGSDSSITINTLGLPAGTFTLDQIAVADDGALYGGNLVLPGDGFPFSLTRWSAVSSGASESSAFSGDPGAGSGDRWGDTISIRGSGTNTQILLGSYGQGYGPGTNVALLTTTDGLTFSALSIPVGNVPAGFAGLGIAFGSSNTFWAKGGHNFNLRQVVFDPTGAAPATVLQVYTAGTQTPNDLTGLGVDAANNILGGVCFNDAPNDLQLYLLTGTTNPPVLFDQTFFGSLNANSQENAVTVMKFPRAFSLDVNNGLVAVTYGVPPPPITPFSVTATFIHGTGVVLSWPAVVGRSYQVQSTPSISPTTWSNVGSPITATATPMSYTNSTPNGALYYRVIGQ